MPLIHKEGNNNSKGSIESSDDAVRDSRLLETLVKMAAMGLEDIFSVEEAAGEGVDGIGNERQQYS